MAQVRGSLVVDGVGDAIYRTTNMPTITNFTIAGWVKPSAISPSYWTVIAGASDNGNWDSFALAQGFESNVIADGKSPVLGEGYAWSVDTWYYLSVSNAGTSSNQLAVRVFSSAGALLHTSYDTNSSSTNPSYLLIGNHPDGEWGTQFQPGTYQQFQPGAYCYWRVWNAVLSQGELEAEMFSETPVRTSNLDSALHNADGTDLSGNGRDWTLTNITTSSDYPDVFAAEESDPLAIPQPLPGALGVYRSIRGRVG